MIERALTTIIENKIKENDKAFLYSYKIKDSDNAKMYIKLEKLVNAEVNIKEKKEELIALLQSKIDWFEGLIAGHETLLKFFKSTTHLIQKIRELEFPLVQMK